MFHAILLYKGDVEFVAMLLITACAFKWGAGPERASAGAIAFMFFIDFPNHWIFGSGTNLSTVDFGHLVIDTITAVILLVIALRANRIYPLWLAAFQMISLGSHLVREMSSIVSPLVYAIMSIAPSYLELIVLTIGLVTHVTRAKRFGPYRSWRNSSSRLRGIARLTWPPG